MIKMKKGLVIAAVSIAILLCGLMASSSLASGASPGGVEDPLVSKSYVDDKIGQVMNLINALSQTAGGFSEPAAGIDTSGGSPDEVVNQVMAQLESLYGLTPGAAPSGSAYKPVFLFSGQFIIGREGTEVILRSGRATAYCPGDSGLSNITQGVEVYGGAEISVNNLIIIPRSDGRGVRASTDAWLLVRGGYDILN